VVLSRDATGAPLWLRQECQVTAGTIGERIAAGLRDLCWEAPSVTVVADQGVPLRECAAGVGAVITAPPGQPAAGLWSVVAGRLPPAWAAEAQRVLLVSYDRALGYWSLCGVGAPEGGAGAGGQPAPPQQRRRAGKV